MFKSDSYTTDTNSFLLFVVWDWPHIGAEGVLCSVNGICLFEWADFVGGGSGATSVINIAKPCLYIPVVAGTKFDFVVQQMDYDKASVNWDDAYLATNRDLDMQTYKKTNTSTVYTDRPILTVYKT